MRTAQFGNANAEVHNLGAGWTMARIDANTRESLIFLGPKNEVVGLDVRQTALLKELIRSGDADRIRNAH